MTTRERRASEQTPATDLTPLELSVFNELNIARETVYQAVERGDKELMGLGASGSSSCFWRVTTLLKER